MKCQLMLIIDTGQHSINVKKHSNAGTLHCQTVSIQDLFQNSITLGNKDTVFCRRDSNSPLKRRVCHRVFMSHPDISVRNGQKWE